MALRLFFSYSHKDEALRDQLQTSLAMLQRQRIIESWHDRRIDAGHDIDHEIARNLEQAEIILFLVSPDFIASDYCYDVEVTHALERHEAGEAHVIPVILRPCEWHPAPFGKLRATPTDGKPVTKFADIDDAFLEVTKDIRRVAEKLEPQGTDRKPAKPAAPAATHTTTDLPRSSNLMVTRSFSDADRDRFQIEAFEYIANYFVSSLSELEQRNTDIQTRFRRIDGNRFTATAYRDGDKKAGCTVFLGGSIFGGEGICYSGGDHGDTKQVNDSLSVGADDQHLYLRTMWGAHRGESDQKLTMEGAAEQYWTMFMEPLQRNH